MLLRTTAYQQNCGNPEQGYSLEIHKETLNATAISTSDKSVSHPLDESLIEFKVAAMVFTRARNSMPKMSVV